MFSLSVASGNKTSSVLNPSVSKNAVQEMREGAKRSENTKGDKSERENRQKDRKGKEQRIRKKKRKKREVLHALLAQCSSPHHASATPRPVFPEFPLVVSPSIHAHVRGCSEPLRRAGQSWPCRTFSSTNCSKRLVSVSLMMRLSNSSRIIVPGTTMRCRQRKERERSYTHGKVFERNVTARDLASSQMQR